jgi:cytosine/creatinine deaminase
MLPTDRKFLAEAFALAQQSYGEGGIPIGSVLVENGQVIGAGYNRRIQDGDPIAHGEMDCIRKAGRVAAYNKTSLYTTLSPCMMCTGTIIQFGIPRVVIGDVRNFGGNEQLLRDRGVEVIIDDHAGCYELMQKFIAERPNDWLEDIGKQPD